MDVDEELEYLIRNGSSISCDNLKKLKQSVIKCVKKDNLADALNDILEELTAITYEYLSSNTINGLSTTIYLSADNSYYLNISGGRSVTGKSICDITEFDIASVTKLFTIILVLKYIDMGIFNLTDRICDIDNRFSYLNFTIEDVLKMAGTIITDSRIDEASSKTEALGILKTVHPINNDMDTNHYTDIGFIVLSEIVARINNKSYSDVITDFFKQYGVTINKLVDIAGNGHKDLFPHDPKARKLEGIIGSAGIFIDSYNLCIMAKQIFENNDFISRNNLKKLSFKLFDKNHPNKGYAGIYLKHALGIKKTSTPNEYSNYSFSHQGFTGSCAIFDPVNRIHNSILVDAIKENELNKHPDFFKYFNKYHQQLIVTTLKSYLIKKYFDTIYKCDVKLVKKL